MRRYIFSADVLRVVAILGVVVIHTFNSIHARPDFVGGSTWWIANFFESAARVSVPLFVMLSGYFILGKQEDVQSTLRRVLHRIFIPYALWLGIYLLWSTQSPDLSLPVSYITLLMSGGAFHLYFLAILIGLYFVSPFLSRGLASLSASRLRTYAFVLLGMGVLYVGFQYFSGSCLGENIFTRWIPFLGYFVAGLAFGKKSFGKDRVWVGIFIVGLLVTMAANFYHLSLVRDQAGTLQSHGCISQYFDNFLSPNVVVMTLAVFVVLFHRSFEGVLKRKRIAQLVKSVAQLSFGTYLSHILIIETLDRFLNITPETYPYSFVSYLFLRFTVVFFLSYFVAWMLLRVSFLNFLVGKR